MIKTDETVNWNEELLKEEPLSTTEERLRNCGSTAYRLSRIGQWVPYRIRCRQRDCPDCQRFYAYSNRLDVLAAPGTPIFLTAAAHIIEQVLQDNDFDLFAKYPQEDGTITLVVSTDSTIPDFQEIDDRSFPWDSLGQAPEGKRRTGPLMNYRKKQKDSTDIPENAVKVTTKNIQIRKGQDVWLQHEANYRSVIDTSHTAPTIDSIQQAHDQRTQAYMNWLNILDVRFDVSGTSTIYYDPNEKIEWLRLKEINSIYSTLDLLDSTLEQYIRLKLPDFNLEITDFA